MWLMGKQLNGQLQTLLALSDPTQYSIFHFYHYITMAIHTKATEASTLVSKTTPIISRGSATYPEMTEEET